MGCLSPVFIKDPRNLCFAGAPVMLQVPCGHCVGCLKKRQNDWSIRVAEELKCHASNCFVTLTYRPENVPFGLDPDTGETRYSLRRVDFVNYLKFLRQTLVRAGYPSPKVYGCGEYGSRTFRPHYHLVIAGCCTEQIRRSLQYWEEFHGFTLSKDIGITQKDRQSVGMYVGKYSSKGVFTEMSPLMVPFIEKPFLSASHFLGVKYIEDRLDYFSLINDYTRYANFDDFVDDFCSNFVYRNGVYTYSLPRYYKDYFFNHVSNSVFRSSILSKTGVDPSSIKIPVLRYGFTAKNGFKSEKAVIVPSLRNQIALSLQSNLDRIYRSKCGEIGSESFCEKSIELGNAELSAKYTLLESTSRSLDSFYRKSRL